MDSDDSIKWRAIYNQSDQVRRLADKIHNSRMLTGPACDQCIEIAVAQLQEDMKIKGHLFQLRNK